MVRLSALVMFLCTVFSGWSLAQGQDLLADAKNLDLINVAAKNTEFNGKSAVHLTGTRQRGAPDMRGGNRPGAPRPGADAAGRPEGGRPEGGRPGAGRQGGGGNPGGQGAGRRAAGGMRQRAESLAIVTDTDFTNGTIELELAGRPNEAAGANARGFVGVAFHVEKTDPIAYDCFYLRPTNGRAEDQLRRNHSCQYMSHPEFPFNKLRREFPGVYESYADLAPGEWIPVKIEVDGEKARLFVNGAQQPCLIVNDLKRAGKGGPIALWLEQSTDAFYRNLKVTEAP